MRPSLKWILLLPAAMLPAAQGPMTLQQFNLQYRRSDPEYRRCELVSALGASRDPEAVPVLARLLENERSCPRLQCYLVKALCEEGSADALEPVLASLVDRRVDPSVPLYARLAMTWIRNPKGLAWMTGPAWKEESRREDLAWALAQDPAWRDPAFFLDHLGAVREKDPRLRAASALGLLRLADPHAAEAVLQAARAEEAPIVLLRLLPAAGRLSPEKALPLLAHGLGHPDPLARLGALEGLGWAAQAKEAQDPALALLVQALAGETGRLRADAARILESLTGKAFGGDTARWKAFLREKGAALPPGFQEVFTEVPRHLGVEMPSRRVVFLIETSVEMTRDRANLQPSDHFERAKREVLKRIEALPKDVSFGVIAFGQSVSRWHDGMTPATDAAKDEACAWVGKLAGFGPPDLGAGLQAAWALGTGPGETPADTVVLVAAGTPLDQGRPVDFSGTLRFPFALTDWVALQGRYRSVVLHAVGVGTSADKKLLKDLAAATGGTYRNID